MTTELGSLRRWGTGLTVSVVVLSIGSACSSSKKNDPMDGTDGSGGSAGDGGDGGDAGDRSSTRSSSSTGGSGGSDGGTSGSGGSDGGTGGSDGGSGGSDGGTGGSTVQDCSSDDDCEDGVCDLFEEVCVECFYDSECGTAERCVAQQCEPIVQCGNSLDCADDQVCDADRGRCTSCVVDADCGDGGACENETCKDYTPCNNSLDCNSNQVCDTVNDRCVRCVTSSDCPSDTVCVGNTCQIQCQSDNQCTGFGLLCNTGQGHCARCLSDDDCPDQYHCDTSQCKVDVCEPGAAYCVDNVLHQCNAAGSDWELTSCGSGRSCNQVSESEASCETWVCTPGSSECDVTYENIIECSDDGLEVTGTIGCGDQICYQGACEDYVCPPSTYICVDNNRHLCDSVGESSSLVETCDQATEYCNPSVVACQPLLCQPEEPACNGLLATTCNATGDGYESGGTDCSDTEQVCVGGACADCNNTVLYLGDDTTAGNDVWVLALENAGFDVTRVDNAMTTYDGAPSANGFGAVILHTAYDYTGMYPAGEASIADAQAAGTGVVMYELSSYAGQNYWSYLEPLTLLSYASSTTGTPTFNLLSTGHPVWDGLPTSWTATQSMYLSYTQLINGGVSIAGCDLCGSTDTYSGSAVAVRNNGGGRIVHIAHWGNYTTTYNDANLVQLNTNATRWATACD